MRQSRELASRAFGKEQLLDEGRGKDAKSTALCCNCRPTHAVRASKTSPVLPSRSELVPSRDAQGPGGAPANLESAAERRIHEAFARSSGASSSSAPAERMRLRAETIRELPADLRKQAKRGDHEIV